MVNGIWGCLHPLLQDAFVKNVGKLYAYDFSAMLSKFYWPTFKRIVKALASLVSFHVTYSRQGVNENLQFLRFLEHTSESFQYFLVQSSDIKSLLISALVSLVTRLKVPILAIFWRFLAFFKLSVFAQAFDLGQ